MVFVISLLLWIGAVLLVWMAISLMGAAIGRRPRDGLAIPAVLACAALVMAALVGFIALALSQEGLS